MQPPPEKSLPTSHHLAGPGYRWLLFDADGTLFDFHQAEGIALRNAFAQVGAAFEDVFLTHYRQINRELWLDLERGLIRPDELKVRRFERLFERIGLRHEPGPFGEIYLECLSRCVHLIEGAQELLQALHGRYHIAILTNGLSAVQRPRFERSLIREYVADLVISEDIGHAKPSAAYFDTALARLGNPPKREVLMIGDSWSSDIVGGANYGLDTCWFNPRREPRPEDPPITREIASLAELREWLMG